MQGIKTWLATSSIAARLFATLLFGAFTYLGINGISDAVQILINPAVSTVLLLISPESAQLRATVLLTINAVIVLSSLATILGIWQSTRLLYGWRVVALMYVALGGYQIVGALTEFKRPEYAITGSVFLLLAAAAYSFGRRVTRMMLNAAR